jgi:hypothetical protein
MFNSRLEQYHQRAIEANRGVKGMTTRKRRKKESETTENTNAAA